MQLVVAAGYLLDENMKKHLQLARCQSEHILCETEITTPPKINDHSLGAQRDEQMSVYDWNIH